MEQKRYDKDIMEFNFEEVRCLKEHIHQDLEILYVLEGNIMVRVGKDEFQMKTDEFLIVESNVEHSYKSKDNILVGYIHVNYKELSQYIDLNQYYFRCNSVIDMNKGYQEARIIIKKIFHLYFEKDMQRVYMTSLYFSLLQVLITNFTFKNLNDFSGDHKYKGDRMEEIIKYIHNNYQNAISLNDLAEHLYLSSAYLSKYVKQCLGVNFFEYLNQVRLKKAMEDIRNTNKTLTMISLDNGFPNPNAFATIFKKEYGQTPSVWVKEHKEELEKQKIEIQQENTLKNIHIRAFLEKKEDYSDYKDEEDNNVFSVDTNFSEVLSKKWNRMINIGSIVSLQRSDLQEQIKFLHNELGFEYIRFWDLFSPEMLQYNAQDSVKRGNYARLDRILDFLISNGMHPFIELGFKPMILLRTIDHKVEEQEREIIFHSHQEVADVLYRFLAHCVNRYGVEEVEKWYFELWGDPRITKGDSYGEYFELFESIYHVLKSISPQISFGGAGFGRLYSTLDFKQIFNLWRNRLCYPDFVSLYCYPYLARGKLNALNSDRIQDPNFVNNQVMMIRKAMSEASFHVQELFVTEWCSSVSVRNSLSDSASQGAFVLKTIIDNIGYLDLLGYWRASDLLSEHFDTGVLLHGGNGLLTVDGIRKPSFYAIKFINRMGKYLLGRDAHSLITTNGTGSYYIACHNYIPPNFSYYLKKEDEIEARKQFLLYDEAKPITFTYKIKNVKAGKYLIKTRTMGQKSGSVQDEWERMGYHEELNQEDITYLREICTPKITMEEYEVKEGVLNIHVSLAPHEIRFIHISYQI